MESEGLRVRDLKLGVWEWRFAALASQTDKEPGYRKLYSWMLKCSWPFCGGCSHVCTSTCSR